MHIMIIRILIPRLGLPIAHLKTIVFSSVNLWRRILLGPDSLIVEWESGLGSFFSSA